LITRALFGVLFRYVHSRGDEGVLRDKWLAENQIAQSAEAVGVDIAARREGMPGSCPRL
jgi:hypothetical protein